MYAIEAADNGRVIIKDVCVQRLSMFSDEASKLIYLFGKRRVFRDLLLDSGKYLGGMDALYPKIAQYLLYQRRYLLSRSFIDSRHNVSFAFVDTRRAAEVRLFYET